MAGRADEIRVQLESLSEELADLAIARLRAALEPGDEGAGEAAAEERRITRARRAVDKAAAILSEIE